MHRLLLLFISFFVWIPNHQLLAQEANTWVEFDAMGVDRFYAPFVKIQKEGLIYFFHPESELWVDQLENKAADMNVAIVDGFYGVVKDNGELLLPFEYDGMRLDADYLGQWYDGIGYKYKYAITLKQGRYGIVDGGDGRIIAAPIYQEIRPFSEDFIAFRDNFLWGIIDPITGEITQPATWTEEELFKFRMKGKSTPVVNATGEITLGIPTTEKREQALLVLTEEDGWYYLSKGDGPRLPFRAKQRLW